MNFSADFEETIERAWVQSSLAFNQTQIRSGYLIIGMLSDRNLKNVLFSISNEFSKISDEQLSDQFAKIVEGSCEDSLSANDGFSIPGESSQATAPQMGGGEALAQYTVDLTQQAKDGKIDPIVGRDEEIRQMVDILMRRRQNNPLLTGEAGVGKTAVVEGFAHRIASGDVPPPLRNIKLLSLDLSLIHI